METDNNQEKWEMQNIHIFREGKMIGTISPDSGGRIGFVFPENIEEDTRADIINALQGIKLDDTPETAKNIRERYTSKGYKVMLDSEVRDDQFPGAVEKKEATPEQKREASFIYESNVIEGITQIPYENILKDIVESNFGGHVSAWNYAKSLAQNHAPLKPEHVCTMQRLLADEQSKHGHFLEEKYRGKVREGDELVMIGGAVKAPPKKGDFNAFFAGLNEKLATLDRSNVEEILRFAAQSHIEYEHMHPFIDGNGRTGRLIINYILAYFGYPPLVITNWDKRKYYKGFTAENNDSRLLEEHFISKYAENEENFK
jgi:hypothetical protein